MYLHLVNPDKKFLGRIRKLFESAMPGEHVYLACCLNGREVVDEEGYLVLETEDLFESIIKDIQVLDGVVINGVSTNAASIMKYIPRNIPVIWVVWGYEVYSIMDAGRLGLYGPKTRAFFNNSTLASVKNRIRPFYLRASGKIRPARNVLKRVNFVVTKYAEEFQLLRRRGFLGEKCVHLELPVMLLEDVLGVSSSFEPSIGRNVQVGNSADPTNNHLEVFDVLRGCDLRGREVIVPLSYGCSRYRDYVIKEGLRLLGEAFTPLVEFMPLPDYLQRTDSCSIVIMNHYRQQAGGNIFAALCRGARVYLGPSALYDSLKRWGLAVDSFPDRFRLDEPDLAQIQYRANLSQEVLRGKFSAAVVVPKMNAFLTSLRAES